MSQAKLNTSLVNKRINPRYIVIDEDIHAALDLYTLSLYMAFRYEADYTSEDSMIRRSAKFLSEKAHISTRQFFKSLNLLEDFGLIQRDPSSPANSLSIYHVAQKLHYFTTQCLGVHDMHRGVHMVHTDHYSLPIIINTNSESCDSPVAAIKDKPQKQSSGELLHLLIDCYRREFPNNPQPHARVISTSLQKTLQSLIKRWPELDPNGNPLTPELFGRYLYLLRTTAPKFSLGEYETQSGNRKKNGLETFARWNTVVKFMENQYS
jgi:hypothetical protein